MQIRFVRLVRSLLLTSLIVVALSATAATVSGPVVVLPNSYYLQPDKDGQTKLVKHDGSRLLPGHVAAYVVAGQIVTGAIGDVPPAAHQFTNDLEFTGGPDTTLLHSRHQPAASSRPTWMRPPGTSASRNWGSIPVHIYPPLPWQN